MRGKEPSIATANNIDTLLGATETSDVVQPPEAVQDKVHFIFNNITTQTLQQKVSFMWTPYERLTWSASSRRVLYHLYEHLCGNPLTPDSAQSKINKLSKIANRIKSINKQHHSKVLLNSFPMNGHTLGFCT